MIPIAPISGCDIPVFQYPACSQGSNRIVTPPTPIGPQPSIPAVTSTTLSFPGTAVISYQIQATNQPTSYGATGLPGFLTLNTSTGVITGTLPDTGSGPYSFNISATNAVGTGFGIINLIITSIGVVFTTVRTNPASGFTDTFTVSIDGEESFSPV